MSPEELAKEIEKVGTVQAVSLYPSKTDEILSLKWADSPNHDDDEKTYKEVYMKWLSRRMTAYSVALILSDPANGDDEP